MRDPVLDTGLQVERTRLAWSRTALSIAANAALLAHHGFATGSGWDFVPAILVACCAAAFAAFGLVRYRYVHRTIAEGRPVAGHRIAAATGGLAVFTSLIVLATTLE